VTAVAVLGTGTMGAPMARNLAAAGCEVVVWNRTAARAEGLGVRVAATPAEAAAGADVLLTMLADADAVAAVAGPALAVLPEGAIWLQMSTVGVAGADRLAALAGERGVTFVDAPVLGSREPAEQGTLVILGSGPEAARAPLAPVLDALAERVVWLGAAGAGSRLKVVVNGWLMAGTAALAETVALAEELGVDPRALLDVTGQGAIGALYTRMNAPAMADREFPLNFPLALAHKDAALAVEAAGDPERLAVLTATREQFARAADLGHGARDWAAVIHAALAD